MKASKKSLLASGVSLLASAALLVGATFAWFTDSVTNTGNKIESGKLAINAYAYDLAADGTQSFTIEGVNGGEAFAFEATPQDLKTDKTPIIGDTLFEPGKSNAKLLKIENAGTLAAKLILEFKVTDNGLMDALWFDFVQVKDGAVVGAFQKRPMSELETIADGMELPLLAGENVQFILIYGMNESAGNAFMEKTFSADVAISATQYTYEKDGFGSDQYDKDADPFVMFGKDIVDALQDPDVSEVVAGEDIDMNRGEFQRPNGNVTVIIPDGKTLDLNQNTIIRPEGGSGDGLSFEAGTTATVKNGTVYAQGDMKAVDVSEGASVTFENMAFEGHGNEILKVRAKSGVKTTVVFRNCTFNNAPITLSGRDGATEIDIQFIDCIFTGTYKMYDDEGNVLTDPYGHIHYTQYMINAASTYLYGDIRIENCTFDFDASEAKYSEEIIELYGCYQSSYPGKMLNVLLKDVTMTGNNVTPVDVDSRYTNGIVLTEEGTNTYTVDGVQVNYDGSAK